MSIAVEWAHARAFEDERFERIFERNHGDEMREYYGLRAPIGLSCKALEAEAYRIAADGPVAHRQHRRKR